jgi:hypothetical protein
MSQSRRISDISVEEDVRVTREAALRMCGVIVCEYVWGCFFLPGGNARTSHGVDGLVTLLHDSADIVPFTLHVLIHIRRSGRRDRIIIIKKKKCEVRNKK